MVSKLFVMFQTAFIIIIAFTLSADANNIMKATIVSGMRIELHILPAEPFFTANVVRAKKVKSGMLIISGAKPLTIEANTHPNRHLVVHIFNAKTGKAVTRAKVGIAFQLIDADGNSAGGSVNVPIVNMQVIGKGPESTHYGNNVVMPEGSYSVTVTVNGRKTVFKVIVSNA